MPPLSLRGFNLLAALWCACMGAVMLGPGRPGRFGRTRLDAHRRNLRVNGQSRRGSKHRHLVFRRLYGTLVKEWQDPRPRHPPQQGAALLGGQTWQGAQAEVSDRMPIAGVNEWLCTRFNEVPRAGPRSA